MVEQPELHLHPHYQANMAEVFAKCIRKVEDKRRPQLHVVVETHSPDLINRLGQLVASKQLDKEDVQVVLFEQDDITRATRIRVSPFDEEGVLTNWPFGFFDPDYQDSLSTNPSKTGIQTEYSC